MACHLSRRDTPSRDYISNSTQPIPCRGVVTLICAEADYASAGSGKISNEAVIADVADDLHAVAVGLYDTARPSIEELDRPLR